jgi:hypothetical protein
MTTTTTMGMNMNTEVNSMNIRTGTRMDTDMGTRME